MGPIVVLVVCAVTLAAVGAGGYWWLGSPRDHGPSPRENSPSPVSPPAPSEAAVLPERFDEATIVTRQTADLLNRAANDMIRRPHQVKPPYPWKGLPDLYRRLVTMVRGRKGETSFWLDHARALAIPYARLADAVSRDPDNPDAPAILTVASENQRGRDFDATVRTVADVVKPRPPDTSSIHLLMQAVFLIVSGDTNQATMLVDRLPAISDDPSTLAQRVVRLIARVLLAYGVKKGEKPVSFARKGLALMTGRLGPGASIADWEWTLILVYTALPSLFADEYGGRKEGAPDVVEEGLELIGRGLGRRPPVPKGVDREIIEEVRRQIRDAAKRGIDQLGPSINSEPPLKDVELGCRAAFWQIVASDPGKEEGKLWYGVYMSWLSTGARTLAKSSSPKVRATLAELDRALVAKQKSEQTGVMTACRARLAQMRGDLALAGKLLALAQAKVTASGLRENDESVWEALDRLSIELKVQGGSPNPAATHAPGPR